MFLWFISILTLAAAAADIIHYRRLRRRGTSARNLRLFVALAAATDALPPVIALTDALSRDNTTGFMLFAMWAFWVWMITVLPRIACYFFRLVGLPRAGIAAGICVAALLIWGTTRGRTQIRVSRTEVCSERIPTGFDGFRIVQFSDVHLGTLVCPEAELSRIADSINSLHPDLVVFCGDLVNIRGSELDARAMRLLGGLRAPYGVVSVTGNHDAGVYIKDSIAHPAQASLAEVVARQREMGWRVLEDTTVYLRRGADSISLTGLSFDPALRERILNLFTQFYGLLRSGHALQNSDLEQGLQLLESDPGSDLRRSFRDEAVLSLPKKTVTARNAAQRAYLETLRSNEMVFSVGPAGTGKTYLAVAMAVHMLNARRVRRIILTRPAVEAGEKLGFLPGDLAEKVNPYLRPLHDALLDMLGPQKMASLQETGIIEVAPLAFMRGRTLNDAFIILDEAQNTTREQMKMFLTRLGFGSRAAITGDITQIDLPAQGEDSASRSGLVHALHVLKGVKGVAFRHFTSADVVRHPLVGRIVQAYDDYEKLPSSHQ